MRNMNKVSTFSCLLLSLSLTACSSLFDNPTVPDGTQSPNTYHSKTGGLLMTQFASNLFVEQIGSAIIDGGLLGDELAENVNKPGSMPTPYNTMIDQRYLPEVSDGRGNGIAFSSYERLHKLRGQTSMARGILSLYAKDLSPAVRGRLMIMDGYARIFLADQYCSGVPLSTLDFNGNYTIKPGSSLHDTYGSAVLMFDSALAISGDSANLMILATLGKARALLGMGRLKEAHEVSSPIQTTDAYRMKASFYNLQLGVHRLVAAGTVIDKEGINGLPYLSSGDPRTSATSIDLKAGKYPGDPIVRLNYPDKFAAADSFDFVLASGIDARLIEAEYQLSLGAINQWLSILNTLRTDGAILRIDDVGTGVLDTVWKAGTGGVDGLAALTDPGSANSRLDLHFKERASWLFMTGNRLPDLRRLVRQYGRGRDEVFPIGNYIYGNSVLGEYGSDINMPIPVTERANTKFKGCMNRDQ